MRKISHLLRLLTETRALKLYLIFISLVGLLSAACEILIFVSLQFYSQLGFNSILDQNIAIAIFALLFIITKPVLLLIGSKYVGTLEYRLYLDSCLHSLTLKRTGEINNESQVVTDAIVNPLRISSTVFTPLVFALPAVLSGFVLSLFLAVFFLPYFVVISTFALVYFTIISRYVNFRLRSLSRATHEATLKAKSLLTFFNTDRFNLNFQDLFHTYLDQYAAPIKQLSSSTAGQLLNNNISKITFEIAGVLFIVYAGFVNDAVAQEDSLTGVGLGIFLFILSRLASISNQIYGVFLSLNTNFTQLSKYLNLQSASTIRVPLDNDSSSSKSLRYISKNLSLKPCKVRVSMSSDFPSGTERSEHTNHYDHFDDLIIDSGELTVITGDSGAGKSTLIRQILQAEFYGIENHSISFTIGNGNLDYGEAFFLGCIADTLTQSLRVSGLSLNDLILLKQPDINTFYEDLAFLMGEKRAAEIISSKHSLYLDRLSGGEQQRLFLAFSSGSNQRLVIVDESLDGLDSAARSRTIKLLLSRGKAILMVTHNLTNQYDVKHRYTLSKKNGDFRALRKVT